MSQKVKSEIFSEVSGLKEFQKFKDQVQQSQRILVSTHLLPDGDGLGAESALFQYLKQTQKECRICNPDAIPQRYRFLDPKNEVLVGPENSQIWDTFDLWIIVDTNDFRRLGSLWGSLCNRAQRIVFLDHHADMIGIPEVTYPPHALLVSDSKSSSIGELLYRLFHELNLGPITPQIALGLYVSVMTDTNSFRYARTTPLAHRVAADMIDLGVNPEEVYQAIYSSKEVSHIQLLGKMLQKVRGSANGKIAWMEMSKKQRHHHQASSDDTLSFLNLLLLLKGAEIVCLFREEDDGKVRVSIKSKGRIVVSKLAMELGGGGHDFAAGLASSGPMRKIVTTVINRIEGLIHSWERSR